MKSDDKESLDNLRERKMDNKNKEWDKMKKMMKD